MNYLFVLDEYEGSGNGVVVSAKRYAAELRARGHEVRFMSIEGPPGVSYPVRESNFPVPSLDRLIKSHGMHFGKTERSITGEALDWADHVHFFMPFPLSISCAREAKRRKMSATCAFHVQPQNISYSIGLGKSRAFNNFLYWLLRAQFFHSFRYIHCPSAFIAGELKQHRYRAECRVISNGIPAEFKFCREPKRPEWEGLFVILMIGRLSGEKRQDLLIEAVRRSRHAQDIQLVLAGQGPKHDAYVKQAADLAHPVVMHFFKQEDLRQVIAECDLYVHAADAEIEAMSCMEAFSTGRVPIIADSPLSATPQFALDARSLFRHGDAGDLASKIDYWIEHPDERAAAEKAYAESASRYSIASCVTKFEQLAKDARENGSWF